MILWIL